MAHPTRGHRSAAYEIQQLVDVDLSALQITIKHSGTYEPVTYTLKAADTPAARQLLQAIAGSIKIDPAAYRDAGWESSETLKKSVWYGKAMLTVFHSLGYDDFSDARLTVPELRKCYDPLPENTKRSAVHLLARAIKDNHPNGKAIAYALKNTRFPAEEHNPFVYDDATAAAIEHAARGVWLERYTAARDIFARLGYDVSGRAWLTIPAGDLLDWAVTSHPDTVPAASPQPRRADFEKEVAWALNHPGAFGLSRGRPRRIDRPSLARIGQALYPDHVTLTAALILHCLSENSGFNYATLLETSTDSLTHLGERTALQRTIKARNATEDSRATSTSSIYTAGGIIEVLTGLTRFTRAARSHLTAPDGSLTPSSTASTSSTGPTRPTARSSAAAGSTTPGAAPSSTGTGQPTPTATSCKTVPASTSAPCASSRRAAPSRMDYAPTSTATPNAPRSTTSPMCCPTTSSTSTQSKRRTPSTTTPCPRSPSSPTAATQSQQTSRTPGRIASWTSRSVCAPTPVKTPTTPAAPAH